MTKHFIAVGIIDHRLVNMPHFLKVNGRPDRGGGFARGLDPMRGIATAAVLSGALWVALIALIA